MTSKTRIIQAALSVAERDGYSRMTRQAVADEAACSMALVSKYWGTMPQLRRAVMRAAVFGNRPSIVAQGLAVNDPQAIRASPKLKKQAARYIGSK